MTLNSPEPELVDDDEETFPILLQVSDNSMLSEEMKNNEELDDTAQNDTSVEEDLSANTSISNSEMDSADCDTDVQSQYTSAKSSDSNEYIDFKETVQVSAAEDERKDIREVYSENAARSTMQTRITDGNHGHSDDVHNESDRADVRAAVEFGSSAQGRVTSVHGNNDAQEDIATAAGKVSSSGQDDVKSVHDNNDAKDDTVTVAGEVSSSAQDGVISVYGNNNAQDDIATVDGEVSSSGQDDVTSVHDNNDAQDDIATVAGVGNSSSQGGATSVHGNNNAQDDTATVAGVGNSSSQGGVTSVHGNNNAQDDTATVAGEVSRSAQDGFTSVHGNNTAQDNIATVASEVSSSAQGGVTSVHGNNDAQGDIATVAGEGNVHVNSNSLDNETDKEIIESTSLPNAAIVSVHNDKDELSDFIASLHREPAVSIEVNDIDLTSSYGELTLCSSTCTLVSETADRPADLLVSSSCSSISSHDSMDDVADLENRVDELDFKYWGKLLASIAGRLSLKRLRYGKARVMYDDCDKPVNDFTSWGVALTHAAEEYIETGFLARRMVLPPCDTMYDQVEKHLLEYKLNDQAKKHLVDDDELVIETETDVSGEFNQSNVNTKWAMGIPQGPQVVIGAGFTAGLCFLCWRLIKA